MTGLQLATVGNWVNVSDFIAAGPSTRSSPYFEYDPTQGSVIVSGGFPLQGSNPLTDTWTYRSGTWTNVTAAVQPIPVFIQGLMAYDAADGYSLEFGGSTITSYSDSNYTWAYSGGNWTNLTSTVGPAPPPTDSYLAKMAYDAVDREIVLWERDTLYGLTSPVETWTYSGGHWTNITASAGPAPPGTIAGALVYDDADGYLVQFGGFNESTSSGPVYENGTWVFRGGSWSELNLTSPSPSPRWSGDTPMVYDPPAQALVLFGGVSERSTALNDTWIFSGGNWTNVTSTLGNIAPYAVFAGDMVWDQADGYVLYMGGVFNYHDTWLLGTPPPFARLNATPSPIEENETFTLRALTAGGSGPLSYQYSGLPPGCPSLNASVVSCSSSTAGTFPTIVTVTDASQRSATARLNFTIQPGPTVARFTITPAVIHVGATVQFATTTSNGIAPFTFDYSGLPIGCSSQNSTAFSCAIGTAATYRVTVNVTDAVGSRATGQATLGVYTLPRLTGFNVSSPWIDLGDAVTFQATSEGGAPPLTFTFGSLPVGCPPSTQSMLTCAPRATGDFPVTVLAVDALGATSSTATAQLHVQPDPSVSGLTATPNPVDVGGTLELNATLVGGTPPFAISWSGLPPGCASSALAFNCTPGSFGSYNVSLVVNDSLGHTASRMVSVEVVPSGGGGTGANFPTTLVVGGAIAAAVVIASVALGVILIPRRHAATVEVPAEDPPDESFHP